MSLSIKSSFIKFFLVLSLVISISYAKEDYSEMSTEELIAIMGYIKQKNQKEFKKELQQRVPTMNSREREFYERNLKNQNFKGKGNNR